MKNVTAAMKAHLAQPYQTIATCWLVVLQNGTVLPFTDHDSDIAVSLEGMLFQQGIHCPAPVFGTLTQTYKAASGYTATNIQTSSALNVDNMEAHGILVAPSITEADLHAGLWDFAFIIIFQVNWKDLTTTMGCIVERCGRIGAVTIERGTFKAELRGMTQAYTRTIGELVGPACRYNLGDARCTVDLAPFTVTGTLTGVNVDNTTVYDTARSEPGPAGGVAITGITNANPGVVTMADASLGLTNGQAVTISGVVGPVALNAITVANSPSGTTFNLSIDTSDTAKFPPYVSGGTVTPLGESGYFDNGVITFTSGLNAGLSMEVKCYVPGQITLQLPMPYLCAAGDAYTMHAGCNKQFLTCKNRFNNVINFGGEPDLPGMDSLVQIGRHS